jgi:LPXTG-site transpeptidase (sortase) family protein
MKRYFDTVILGLGIVFLLFGCYLVWERTAPVNKVRAGSVSTQSTSAFPFRLVIPNHNIDVPIVASNITNGSWETTREGVSYLTSTALPGEAGNSVIYGHNWPNLLGNLKNVKPGDKIDVYKGGEKYTYTVHYTMVVSPDQTHITFDTSDSRLTVYTCTGFLDAKRFVAVGILD